MNFWKGSAIFLKYLDGFGDVQKIFLVSYKILANSGIFEKVLTFLAKSVTFLKSDDYVIAKYWQLSENFHDF